MILKFSEEFAPAVAEVLRQVSIRLSAVLPDVAVHHVGATAIPGALTKGDVDVVLRVERSDFASAVERLRANFDVKQPENWHSSFASFGSDAGYPLPLGVQLVVKESSVDFLVFIRDYLIRHPAVLADYNRAKRENAERSADEYWSAKDRILSPIVALKISRIEGV